MNMIRITKPGIYTDMSAADYFADPCPDPSLTQSLAKLLLDRSPLHAWYASPKLNPRFERDEATRFDLGNAAHWHLIGRGKDMVVIEAPDWRTKDAKAARDAAVEAGKSPVLREQFDRAGDMAEAALNQLAALGLVDEWRPEVGHGEAVIANREGDIWLRAMIDWLPHHKRVVWDYKSTRASAAPHAVSARMGDTGWHIQAAMHERLLNAIDPDNAGRRRHLFVCQECDEPYALTVSEISEASLTIGRMQIQHAINLWARCVAENRWPGYPQEITAPELPPWAQQQWLEQEIERGRSMPSDLLMAG